MVSPAVHKAPGSLDALRERFTPHKRTLSLIFGVLLLVGAVGFGYVYLSADPDTQSRSLFLPLAVLCAVFGAPTLLTWIGRGGWTVEVYEHGLARIRGNETKKTRWEDIVAVWYYQTRRTSLYIFMPSALVFACRIQTVDGEKFTMDHKYKNSKQLGAIIQSEATNRLLPQMMSAYQSGQTVSFGDLSLNQQGLIYKEKQLPWTAFKEMKIDRSTLTIYEEGGGLRPWLVLGGPGDVPNLSIFETMVKSIRSEMTSRLLPQMMNAYQSGQTVSFGDLSLNQQGLIFKEKQLPWTAFKELKIDRGSLTIYEAGQGSRQWAMVQAASVPNLSIFETMVKHIRSEMANRLLPQMMSAYQSGQTVSFGDLSLNQQGLIFKDKQLPWNKIKEVKLMYDRIAVEQTDGRYWAAIAPEDIPNHRVFLAMVESIQGVRSR